jgi:hypothetical protein
MQDQIAMIILKVTKTFPVRVMEWLLAGMMLSWGIAAWNLPEQAWNAPYYSGLSRIAEHHTWGAVAATIGILRLAALFRNGGWRPSPHLRAGCAFLACFVWLQLSLGYMAADITSMAIAVYPWLLLADIYNVFRASSDARDSDDRALALIDAERRNEGANATPA